MANEKGSAPRVREKKVCVIGGGVAGMTAAHELIERGFEVHVFEKLARPFDPNDCEVGGLARTQWCDIGSAARESSGSLLRAASLMGSEPRLGEVLHQEIPFKPGSYILSPEDIDGVEAIAEEIRKHGNAWAASVTDDARADVHPEITLCIEGYATEAEGLSTSLSEMRQVLTDLRLPRCPSARVPEANMTEWSETAIRPADTQAHSLSRCRALMILAILLGHLNNAEGEVKFQLWLWALGLGGVPRSFPDEPIQGPVVRLRLHAQLAPGEHGYRYFPAFYRHVFDTMKRIPVYESAVPPRPREARWLQELAAALTVPRPHNDEAIAAARRQMLAGNDMNLACAGRGLDSDQVLDPLIRVGNRLESPRTVFDNLIPTHDFTIAIGGGTPPLRVSRLRPRSFQEIRRLLSDARGPLSMSVRDGLRFELKLAQYMTSCPARRKTYEGVTWSKFLGADRCSEQFRGLIESWPQALVGIRASVADARTIGTVTVQILLDQMSDRGYRDGTLNGPTTRAWLEPWRRYLEARGVRFQRGALGDLALENGTLRLDMNIDRERPGEPPPPLRSDGKTTAYVVLAVPPLEAKRLITSLRKSCAGDPAVTFPSSFAPLLSWPLPGPGARGGLAVERECPSGPLRHYGGIQFYLAADLGPAQGHTYFATSEWRLSAISQAQFWQRRTQHGETALQGNRYVSVLSVDIGDWHAPAPRLADRFAVECTRGELAREVWNQIEDGIKHHKWKPPKPFAYHLDDDMLYEKRGTDADERPTENFSSYPVNLAGDWDNHPGTDEGDAYEVFEGLVLAGSYVKTRTRLTTMESANESARRAVNAILDDYQKTHPDEPTSDRCQIWDPEEHEIDDLTFLKDVDAKLMEQGIPHMLDVLEVDKLIDDGLEVLAPEAILAGVLCSFGLQDAATPQVAGLPLARIRRALEALFG